MLQAPTSTIFGSVFFGAAALFAHAVTHPQWAYAAAPLWSFLAYDFALFVPYGRMLSLSGTDAVAMMDEYGGADAMVNLPSLIVFLMVLGTNCLIALYALFINPATRALRPHASAIATDS